MTILGFSLVLAAAFAHATWNFLVKRLNGGPELLWLFAALSLPVYGPFALCLAVTFEGWSGPAVLALLGTAILHLGYFLLLQAGYRVGDLSVIYPTARATGPVLSSLLALLLLGQALPAQAALGGAIIVFGVMMLTGGPEGSARPVKSLLYGLAVGTLIGAYTVWDAWGVSVLLIPPVLMDYASAIGRSVLLYPYARRRWDKVQTLWHDHRWEVMAIAVLNSGAYILVLYALTFTPVIYVAPLREVSVLIAVLLGSVLLGEGQLARRMGWAVVILAGVSILATS
ncbi:EamA family transporter [Hasllibacter sp. MH4015]|uniref:EamA family transporter n=1 Tax=Hasllibacter sp. MH4015 TaxID=2854029 RepID=UPI001CD4645E|nr:EamA family transporter [Hasllibacter sp. MH4015]